MRRALAHEQERAVKRLRPDVVLSDIDMPGGNGLPGLRAIRAENAQVSILMLTVFEEMGMCPKGFKSIDAKLHVNPKSKSVARSLHDRFVQ